MKNSTAAKFNISGELTPKRVVVSLVLALVLVNGLSTRTHADIITSRAIARIGSGVSEVIDWQSNAFNNLAASTSGVEDGVILTSDVDATFFSEDLFQVDVTSTWDFRNVDANVTVGFGRNFEYEFLAEGNLISVTGTNVEELPLFGGATTTGMQPFRWRIFDLTTPNGYQAIEFDSDGTQTLSIIDGHDYLLRLSDNSNLSSVSTENGIFHSATFEVSVPAKFSAIPEPGSAGILILVGSCLLTRRRRRQPGQTPLCVHAARRPRVAPCRTGVRSALLNSCSGQ